MPHLISQRMPELMEQDERELHRFLEDGALAHIGMLVEGRALVFPTGYAMLDGELVIHGSTGSRWMRQLPGAEVSVTVTKLDGGVVARSTYESSMMYRSAMLFGRFAPVSPDHRARLLADFADHLIPGRSAEVRGSSTKELAATMLLRLELSDWSFRVSDGWPEDEERDLVGDAWAGQVRFGPREVEVTGAPDLRAGIPIPESVARLATITERFC